MSSKYLKDDTDNIITSHGCKCKKKFYSELGNTDTATIEKKWTKENSDYEWCEVNSKCGLKSIDANNTNYYWDWCFVNDKTVYNNSEVFSYLYTRKVFTGFLLFIIVFVLLSAFGKVK